MSAEFKHIEWHHIDKKKFYAVWSISYLSINMCSYPALLVKTRLQVQTTRGVYKNTFHAFTQITRTEGWRGLYKGFFVGQLNLMADYMYYTSYEVSREQLSALSFGARGFFAGSVAAAAEQCFCCPVDVVSQRLMIQRHSNGAKTVVTSLLANSGFCGLYRGFTAAIMQEGVQNGVLWASYGIILDLIGSSVPVATPRIVIQGSAGAVSGLIAAVIGNPLDIIRVRMQVSSLLVS